MILKVKLGLDKLDLCFVIYMFLSNNPSSRDTIRRICLVVIQVCYKEYSISNWPDLFLTDRHNQDFNSAFGHHIQIYVQNLNIIGLLVGNLSRLQAWPVTLKGYFLSNLVVT